jgi:hypothetical protein
MHMVDWTGLLETKGLYTAGVLITRGQGPWALRGAGHRCGDVALIQQDVVQQAQLFDGTCVAPCPAPFSTAVLQSMKQISLSHGLASARRTRWPRDIIRLPWATSPFPRMQLGVHPRNRFPSSHHDDRFCQRRSGPPWTGSLCIQALTYPRSTARSFYLDALSRRGCRTWLCIPNPSEI